MDDSAASGRPRGDRHRRWRRLPPAITPITARDIAAGLVGQHRGRGLAQFRDDIETLLDAEASATYSSFRRALAACLHELRARDERDRQTVLIPAFCSADFPDAIAGVGLDPVRYDVDPATLGADHSSLRESIDDPLAVVAVNVLGYTSRMDRIGRTCDRHDTALVEALGYALGSQFEGRPLGTFGDCAVLNFQQGKPIPVGGGMIASQTDTLDIGDAGRSAVGANVGALAGYAALSGPRPYFAYTTLKRRLEGVVGSIRPTTHPDAKYDVAYDPPFGTMSEFQGAIAHRVFERRERDRRHRERQARAYAAAIADWPRLETPASIAGLTRHQHVRFPLLAAPSIRDRLLAALDGVGVGATPLYDWPVLDPERFPGASAVQRSILTLPTHPYVDTRDHRAIVETIRQVCDRGA